MTFIEQINELRKHLGNAQADIFNITSTLNVRSLSKNEELHLQQALANARILSGEVAEYTKRVAQILQ
jgi:hypothetical protein